VQDAGEAPTTILTPSLVIVQGPVVVDGRPLTVTVTVLLVKLAIGEIVIEGFTVNGVEPLSPRQVIVSVYVPPGPVPTMKNPYASVLYTWPRKPVMTLDGAPLIEHCVPAGAVVAPVAVKVITSPATPEGELGWTVRAAA
jgi:hypothetical protein